MSRQNGGEGVDRGGLPKLDTLRITELENSFLNMYCLLLFCCKPLGKWTHLTATFSFKRRLGYSLIQVYAPTILIVILSWLSFWISQEAVPARVALGVTTVLTIVTLMGSFRSQVPKVMKFISLFYIATLWDSWMTGSNEVESQRRFSGQFEMLLFPTNNHIASM